MTPMEQLKAMVAGKKVAFIGAGVSHKPCFTMLAALGADITLCDQKKSLDDFGDYADTLRKLNVKLSLGEHYTDGFAGQDIIMRTPGYEFFKPELQAAKQAGALVTSEVELFFELCPCEIVAVTGSDGKTTTTTLLGKIFENAGRVTHVAGNIGYPLSAVAMKSKKDDVVVVEVSSFQLESIKTFHPHVAALLNITEDHLNRHGTMAQYIRLKQRIFENQTGRDYAVLNMDDPVLFKMAGKVKSQVAFFSRTQPVENGAFVEDGKIVWQWNGARRTICDAEQILIPGPHNLENALAATAMACAMGVPAPVIRHTLQSFSGVEHRIEKVRVFQGVTYINDSKGTNVDSTIKAVQSMKAPTVLLLGGYDKHTDFMPLCREIIASGRIDDVVVMGETARQIREQLEEAGYDRITQAYSLRDAVDKARALAVSGGNVLLSPACASFDMFRDYEHRGAVFKEIVNALC